MIDLKTEVGLEREGKERTPNELNKTNQPGQKGARDCNYASPGCLLPQKVGKRRNDAFSR